MKEEGFFHEVSVRYGETDMMGITHHRNYFLWFEETRVKSLEYFGLPYEKWEEEGIILPVSSCSCEFIKPTTFGDKLKIQMGVSKLTGRKVSINYEVYNGDILCAQGETIHPFLNINFKSINLQKEKVSYFEFFKKLLNENKENSNSK